jgi:hypothetical protein
LNGGKPTNIPSLWERKIVDQNTAVEKALQSKKEYKSFDTIKEAVSDSERKSNAGGANAPEGYNKGGAVRNLLATGGVMQEGGTKDPVSGNDVPAGALKEEVRDDVPAQLSPGEFVFPADVTRYIGLEKLMQIREAAKEGLKEMESKGQMGNAEEVEGDAVDEDKFSSHIDEIMAGLEGGEGAPKKYAVGGSVNTSDYSAAPIKGFKMVQYEDVETKTVKYIPFVNGKALLPIPKGYVEKKAAAPVAPVAPVVPVEDQARAGGGDGGGGRGDRLETDGDGVGVNVGVRDTGIEGFGDIQSGTNKNVARAIGGGVSLIGGPIAGLLAGALGQYVIKKNNEVMANANVEAISFSALEAAGFSAKDIALAQDAAAKATMEGKSAKEVAVAAANAASSSAGTSLTRSVNGEYGTRTTLDALVGITNGWNTTTAKDLKTANSVPNELAGKISPGFWSSVTKSIDLGLTPAQAVAEAQIAAEAEAFGGVPAGKYNDVLKDVQDGMTVGDAIAKANREEGVEPFMQTTDVEGLAPSDRNMAAQREARAEEARMQDREEKATLDRDVLSERQDKAEKAARDAADRAAEAQADREAQAQRQADSEAKSERASQFDNQQSAREDGSYSNSLSSAGTDTTGDDGGP